MKELDLFYLQQEEPVKSCFLFLREHILNCDKNITEAWKFRMPFFCYKGQSFCYFRIERKSEKPYIGFTEGKWLDHPALVSEKRSRIKILLVDQPPTFHLMNWISFLRQLSNFATQVCKFTVC